MRRFLSVASTKGRMGQVVVTKTPNSSLQGEDKEIGSELGESNQTHANYSPFATKIG